MNVPVARSKIRYNRRLHILPLTVKLNKMPSEILKEAKQ